MFLYILYDRENIFDNYFFIDKKYIKTWVKMIFKKNDKYPWLIKFKGIRIKDQIY